ncbi:MAG: Hpt domain-containing protein [Mangrovicoccus sp.]
MLDWSRVEELREEVGEDAFGEVVELFLEEVGEAIGALANGESCSEENMHFIKGAALNLGFQDLANLCQSGESLARDGAADQIDLPKIVACFGDTRDAFMTKATAEGVI